MSRGVSQARFLDSGEDASVWLRPRRNERNDNTRRVRIAILPGRACSCELVARCRVQGQTRARASAYARACRRSPTSFGVGAEFDGSFETDRTSPVWYMSPRNQAPKSSKFRAQRSLLIVSVSPLSRPPGYLVKYAVKCPESNLADYSPHCPVRNQESYLDDYPASYWASYLPENPASSREDCRDGNSADYAADCPDNRPVRNPESNREHNGADNSPDDSESDLGDSVPDCSASYLPGFGHRHGVCQ